jgi:penicillin-insensitive murein endopeptidase
MALADNQPAREKVSRWGAQKTPASGDPRSIGDYSSGCVQGAQALPLLGPGYQVMHPSRVRHFGHPALVDFLQKLGESVHGKGMAPLLIGDLSQPRGGRASGGHASHQTGLDVDLWYWHPRPRKPKTLSDQELETIKARTILDGKTQTIAAAWQERVQELLQLTAEDPRVERIFVHPIIKRDLCAQAPKEAAKRAWLSKLRPWYGHDDHFHVRLACPKDSPDCVPQAPQAKSDGCEELSWWFDAAAQADRDEARKQYRTKVITEPKLPAQCEALLE